MCAYIVTEDGFSLKHSLGAWKSIRHFVGKKKILCESVMKNRKDRNYCKRNAGVRGEDFIKEVQAFIYIQCF